MSAPRQEITALAAYRGRLQHETGPEGVRTALHLPALDTIENRTARDEVRELLRKGHENFYGRAYVLALRYYRDAEAKVASLPDSDVLRLSVSVYLADALYELFRFDDAAKELIAVSKHRRQVEAEKPISATVLWVKLAKVFLADGDSLYRAAANKVNENRSQIEAKYDLILGAGHAPDPASPLYQDSLAVMVEHVRRVVRSIDDATVDTDVVNPEIVALVYDCRRRFDQLVAGLNFLGHGEDYVPILRFAHLKDVARTFAQIAAQANREYLGYVSRIQSETFTLRQLEQAVEVNRAGVDVHRSATHAADEEVRAARQAGELARTRREQAQRYRDDYAQIGYETVLLDEALSWAQATAVPHDEQIRLQYEGIEHLGIVRRYQPRSKLIQELTYQRARRNYDLQRRRLTDQVDELREAERLSVTQVRASQARADTALLRQKAAEARLRHSVENLESVRSREFGIEFFSEIASLVRDTAHIYLQHAMLIAFMMERAYEFETGNDLRKIRLDYGDMDGAEGIYAADLLLRDIDYFTFESIVGVQNKVQPAMRVLSLATEYPLEFLRFRATGQMRFATFLVDFQRGHPGMYNGRIKDVIVKPIGLVGTQGPIGWLTVNGISSFRDIIGTIRQKMHASETLLLSAYNSRRDSIFASAPHHQLGVFENVGLGCDWLLEVPQAHNYFDIAGITDFVFAITYLCEVDRALAARDITSLPSHEEAEMRFSLKRDFQRDAFYWLEATARMDFSIDDALLPSNHRDARLRALRLIAIDREGHAIPLIARFWSSAHGSESDRYEAAANGVLVVLNEDDTGGHHDQRVAAGWSLVLRPGENLDLRAGEASERELDLSRVEDLFMVLGYRYQLT